MFDDEQVIRSCIQHRISVEQYFFMWLLRRRDFHLPEEKSLNKQYVKLVKQFSLDDVRDLVEKEFLDDFNSAGESIPDLYVLKPKSDIFFTNEDSGEELFREYPVTFPLHEKGASFLARTGGDKKDLIDEYERRIKYSRKKHEFVIRQLRTYKVMVQEGRINGYRIVDWIKQELWDSIAQFQKQELKHQSQSSEDI